ncbi:hypothetical protein [Desertimonas flava]|uniref:hypothetical protein n=1 Tax=Desertimonas flava TaxID=2064846 RepID=UPI000E35495A|nr:hypothetical protein [Desertimonas flava]
MSRALAVAVAAAVLVAFLVAPARVAAAGELQLSRDGLSWADRLDEPLFDDAVSLVPGGTATAVFHVRNASDGGAELRVAATAVDAAGFDPAQLRIELAVSPSAGGTSPAAASRTFAAARSTPDFGIAEPMAAGTSRLVAVTVHLDATAGNDAQRRSFSVALEIRLRDAVAIVPVAPGGPSSPSAPDRPADPTPPNPLSRTGAAMGGIVAVAAALVAAGAIVRAVARRRHRPAA